MVLVNQQAPVNANAFQGQLCYAFSRCQNMDVPDHDRALGQHPICVQCNYVLIWNYGKFYLCYMAR